MMITRVLYWHPTGPKISYSDGLLIVEDLNPDAKIQFLMSRWDMIKLAWQCLRTAIIPPTEKEERDALKG